MNNRLNLLLSCARHIGLIETAYWMHRVIRLSMAKLFAEKLHAVFLIASVLFPFSLEAAESGAEKHNRNKPQLSSSDQNSNTTPVQNEPTKTTESKPAQGVSDPTSLYGTKQQEGLVKAAYLTGFAIFSSWPANAAFQNNTHFQICTFGERPSAMFSEKLAGQVFQGKPIKMWHRVGVEELPACDITYITTMSIEQTNNIIALLGHQPTLIVGDLHAEPKSAFAVQFIRSKAGKIDFRIDRNVLRNRGLEIPTKLLKLAAEVE